MSIPMRAATAALALFASTAFANMGDDNAPKADANFDTGRKAIEAENWPAASAAMRKAIAADPGNPDAHNWLGYVLRKQGNYEASFVEYGEALRLNPKHKAARVYLGEAYLATRQLAKAEEQLGELARLCTPIPCEEQKDLKRAIDDYKKKNGS